MKTGDAIAYAVAAVYVALMLWFTGYGGWWTGVDVRDQIALAHDRSCGEGSDKPGTAPGACSWESVTTIRACIVEVDARYDRHDEYEITVASAAGARRTFRIDDVDTYEAAQNAGAKSRLQTFRGRAIRLTSDEESANADESPMWRLSKDPVPLIGAGVMWMFFFAMRAAMRDAAERKAKSAEGSS